MYSKISNIVLAFHGCDKNICDSVVNGGSLQPSTNDYDWLGHGVYFWESDPVRAYEWAVQLSKRVKSNVHTPAVLGAIIDLGRCLDLTNRQHIEMLSLGYDWLKQSYKNEGKPLPRNENVGSNNDWLMRNLDCAVIEGIHAMAREEKLQGFDSVRCMFTEGGHVYDGSSFREKTHIQICVVNPNCIKGYFLPREADSEYNIP